MRTRAHALAIAVLVFASFLSCLAQADPPEGEFRILFSAPATLSMLPESFSACEDDGVLSICTTFRPSVDPRGRVGGQVDVQLDGLLNGVSVADTLTGGLRGKISGKTGDGSAPLSKVSLSIALSGTVRTGDQDRIASHSAKLKGRMDHAATDHALGGSRKLTVQGVGSRKGKARLGFSNAGVDGLWSVDLSLLADGAKISGSAVPVFRGRVLGQYAASGQFSQKRQSSSLSFKPDAALKGTSLSLGGLVTFPDGTAGFKARYRMMGHKGSAGSAGNSAEWAWPSEGSCGAPLDLHPWDLTGLLPYEGTVGWRDPSCYIVGGLVPGAVYTVTLERLELRPYLTVPVTEGFGGVNCGQEDNTPGAVISCATKADGAGELRFEARTFDGDAGGRFRLSLSSGGIINQGTPSDPHEIPALPFRGGAIYQSYYVATGLTPNRSYTFSFSDVTANGATFWLYDKAGFGEQLCRLGSDDPPGSACTVKASGEGRVYVKATVLQGNNVEYSFTLELGGIPNEGTVTDPVELTGILPYAGSVSTETSYYHVGGLTPGVPYTVTLSSLTDTVRLDLYCADPVGGGAGRGCQVSSSESSVEGVVRTNGAGVLWIAVFGFDTVAGATYTISVAPGGLPNEGCGVTAVDVTGTLPRPSTIYNGPSRYRMAGLNPATTYTVKTYDGANIYFYVYSAPWSGDDLLCSSSQLGIAEKSCSAQTPTGELCIWVNAFSGTQGHTFILDLE